MSFKANRNDSLQTPLNLPMFRIRSLIPFLTLISSLVTIKIFLYKNKFLHWFHHFSVCLCIWYILKRESVSWWQKCEENVNRKCGIIDGPLEDQPDRERGNPLKPDRSLDDVGKNQPLRSNFGELTGGGPFSSWPSIFRRIHKHGDFAINVSIQFLPSQGGLFSTDHYDQSKYHLRRRII